MAEIGVCSVALVLLLVSCVLLCFAAPMVCGLLVIGPDFVM